MTSFTWLGGEERARCPVCTQESDQARVVSAPNVDPRLGRVTFLRCGHCGSLFLDDLTPPDYGAETVEMLDYYVEQGAGIDLVVAPLIRIPRDSVRRCMEIGCSFPFALDFARFHFGCETLGVDPSPLAVKGAAQLGLRVIHDYFSAGLDVGAQPFDLVLCSEILEHVANPHPLLAAIRGRLGPDGLLVLSTPNAAIIREDAEEGMLARAMSPGYHLVLYTRRALHDTLAAAGFEAIRIEESPETLRVFASASRAAIERLLPLDAHARQEAVRTYFQRRAREVPSASPLASGLAYRHFKECVNAGLYADALTSREFLAQVYRDGAGFDLMVPSSCVAAAPAPYNLSCALFFCGILELNAQQCPERAAEYFDAAIQVTQRLRETAFPFALFDGETEMLLRQSLKHLPMALAAIDPERALRKLRKLESLSPTAFPGELLRDTKLQTFMRLVHAGQYEAAEHLAPEVSRLLEARTAEQAAAAGALDPLFGLAMLALQRGRPDEAAELFGRVSQAAARAGRPEERDLLESARHHESLSRAQAERR